MTALDEAAIIVIYGRRRVGKTELIEQFFRQRHILKFEGLQPDRLVIRKSDPDRGRSVCPSQGPTLTLRLGQHPGDYGNASRFKGV